jgi:hypothetical protein
VEIKMAYSLKQSYKQNLKALMQIDEIIRLQKKHKKLLKETIKLQKQVLKK